MAEYISREAALEAIREIRKKAKSPFEVNRILDCVVAIQRLPGIYVGCCTSNSQENVSCSEESNAR